MPQVNKIEINLEVNAGFFRISTEDVVYNITVLGERESSTTKVIEKIVEREKREESPTVADQSIGEATTGEDQFFKEVSTNLYQEIGSLARQLSSTIMAIPAEDRRQQRAQLDEVGDKLQDAKTQLKDIVAMTEKAAMKIMDSVEKIQRETLETRDLLSNLKDHQAFANPVEAIVAQQTPDMPIVCRTEDVNRLLDASSRMVDIVSSLLTEGPETNGTDAGDENADSDTPEYAFSMDVIFQTLYEFCTNEAVKKHISTARQKAGEIFEKDVFSKKLNAAVADMVPDTDNFFNVSLPDIFDSFLEACNTDSFKKLILKMNENRDTIFLDKTLPLEAPAKVAPQKTKNDTPKKEKTPDLALTDPRFKELNDLAADSLSVLQGIQSGNMEESQIAALSLHAHDSIMAKEDQVYILSQIESAFAMVTVISDDVAKIMETLSFQDLSGQRIMKIIKLLSDFEIQLLALIVSFGSQLKHKETNKNITVEESKALAQKDVDSLLSSLIPDKQTEDSMLDQGAVNSLLGEMGF